MKLMGHIILPSFVRPSVRLSLRHAFFVCACHILRTLHIRVLKFDIWVPHEKIADPYFFFLSGIFVFLELCPFEKSELNLVSKTSRKVFKLGS